MQSAEEGNGPQGSVRAEFFDPLSIAEPDAAPPSSGLRTAIVARPSVETGDKYKQVSAAYIEAVHSVLTGKKEARESAAELEKQLVEITGFRTGPPLTADKMVR
jgi:trehalose/maltose transport system substrate-binding protein